MKAAAPAIKVQERHSSESEEDTLQTLRGRKLDQLYIGLAGPMGSGATLVSSLLKEIFEQKGYEVYEIKVSELIKQSRIGSIVIPSEKSAERIHALQNKGDAIRAVLKFGIAQLICTEIVEMRRKRFGDTYSDGMSQSFKESLKQKAVFIFDSLKNPHEVELLREIYKDAFYLFGIVSLEATCRRRFVSKGYDETQFHNLYRRDAACDESPLGQQVQKTLQQADLFINNNYTMIDALKKKLERHVKLVTKSDFITPTMDETAMHHAYVAGARSACLSRQVGAAIVSLEGNLISTGCNDVPKSGGGLYTSNDRNDQRCFNKSQRCSNDQKKKELLRDIHQELKEIGVSIEYEKMETALRKTRIKDLIEFSRAVHAEMDAIVRVASDGMASTNGAILYSTTFPCHNCARHIVAAGISKVFYIEPYVKSLAPTLHDDAITLEEDTNSSKVAFLPYEGVAPRRYLQLFEKVGWKDKEGKIKLPSSGLPNGDRQPVDSFYELEQKVVKDLGKYLD